VYFLREKKLWAFRVNRKNKLVTYHSTSISVGFIHGGPIVDDDHDYYHHR